MSLIILKNLTAKKFRINEKLFIFIFLCNSISTLGQKKHPNDTGQKIRVPVLFHVVDKHLKKGDISLNDFQKLVDAINDAFRDGNTTGINDPYDKNIAKCNIEFYLPKKNINGNILDPISWDETDKNFLLQKTKII